MPHVGAQTIFNVRFRAKMVGLNDR